MHHVKENIRLDGKTRGRVSDSLGKGDASEPAEIPTSDSFGIVNGSNVVDIYSTRRMLTALFPMDS